MYSLLSHLLCTNFDQKEEEREVGIWSDCWIRKTIFALTDKPKGDDDKEPINRLWKPWRVTLTTFWLEIGCEGGTDRTIMTKNFEEKVVLIAFTDEAWCRERGGYEAILKPHIYFLYTSSHSWGSKENEKKRRGNSEIGESESGGKLFACCWLYY